MGIETALIVGGLLAAGGIGAAATGAFSKDEKPKPAALPATPDAQAAAEQAQQEEVAKRKKRMAKASTILTSPQGALGDAPVATKTLLGQ
jgi:hypothetical protein